jgi:ribose transport system substrate-binding protein
VPTFAEAGFDPAIAQAKKSEKPLKAASRTPVQASYAPKQAAEAWGALMNVEITWFDGELSATKQRAAIDTMASQKWDFVSIQTFGIGTLSTDQEDDRRRHARHRHGHLVAPDRQFAIHTSSRPTTS